MNNVSLWMMSKENAKITILADILKNVLYLVLIGTGLMK